MDRVKAAIFSSLGDAVIGARVLDLFAGSGALGIEALSRGASLAVFIEQDRQSAETIKINLGKTKLTGRVRGQDVFDFLQQASTPETFQIIFADPPYQKTKRGERYTEKLLLDQVLPQLLDVEGVFVLEKDPSERIPVTKFWNIMRARKYGATEVLFLSAIRNSQPSIR